MCLCIVVSSSGDVRGNACDTLCRMHTAWNNRIKWTPAVTLVPGLPFSVEYEGVCFAKNTTRELARYKCASPPPPR